MKDRTLKVLAILLLSLPVWANAQPKLYKIVDENGNVTYTDKQPSPDAKPMTLPGLSVISPQKNSRSHTSTTGEAAFEDADAQEITDFRELRRGYADFHLVTPENEESIWGSNNEASVAWDTRYRLQRGMTVVFFMDEEPQPPTTAPVMNFVQLDRGEHKVYAELRDSRGRTVARSDMITFYIMQPSLLNPNRPGGAG